MMVQNPRLCCSVLLHLLKLKERLLIPGMRTARGSHRTGGVPPQYRNCRRCDKPLTDSETASSSDVGGLQLLEQGIVQVALFCTTSHLRSWASATMARMIQSVMSNDADALAIAHRIGVRPLSIANVFTLVQLAARCSCWRPTCGRLTAGS